MKKTLLYGLIAAFVAVSLFAAPGSALAAFTVSNTGPNVIDTVAPNNIVSVAVTSTLSPTTISWGLRGGNNAQYGGGSINIAAGQSVGFGSATISAPPGTYQLYATSSAEPAGQASGSNITVQAPATPQIPTNPPTISTINGQAPTPPVYSKDRKITVAGTADPSTTLEVQLNGAKMGTALATIDGKWTLTVSTTADGAQTVQAVNARGSSTAIQVTVDTVKPDITRISYTPSAMPFGIGTVNVRVTASENLKSLNLSIVMPDGSPSPVTLTTVAPNIYEFNMTIARGTPSGVTVNGHPTAFPEGSTFTFFAVATDNADNVGTTISQGGTFTVNSSGPNGGGATVTIANGDTYTSGRTLSFNWKNFTHSLGTDKITRYWTIASQTPVTAPANDTNGWTGVNAQNPPGDGSGSGILNVTADGTWSVYVKSQDANNNFSAAISDSIIVDSLGPAVDAGTLTPTNGFANATEQTEIMCNINEAVSGLNRDTVVMTVNGTSYAPSGSNSQYTSPAMTLGGTGTPGVYRIIFRPSIIGLKFPRGQVNVTIESETADMVGNRLGGTSGAPGADYTWSFTVNTNANAPIPNQAFPPAGNYYKTKRPQIILHLDDADGIDSSSLLLTVANGNNFMSFNVGPSMSLTGPAGTDSVVTITPPTDFADGTTTVTLQTCRDRIGNSAAPYNWTFHLDNTPPVPSNPNPGNGMVTSTQSPIISLKLDDAGSGLDTSTTGVQLIVTYRGLNGTTWTNPYTIDNPAVPALTYNPSTKTLSFNPTLDPEPNHRFGIGSVEVTLSIAMDRAVTPTNPPASSPNALLVPYTWSFSVSTSAGPVVSMTESVPLPPDQATGAYRMSNLEPLIIRTLLIDEDLIDHRSLLIDFNGRTFRDGDRQVSWITTSSTTAAGSHEALLLNLSNDASLIKQGTNELHLRAASDRTGKPLQLPQNQSYVNLSFVYDTEGPKAASPDPADGGIIYDLNNGPVRCKVTDNLGPTVEKVTLRVLDVEAGTSNIYGTDSTPVNLAYDKATGDMIFRNTTPYRQGKRYTFSVIPPTAAGQRNGTVDMAGNGLNKAIGSSATSEFSWTLTAANTDSVVVLQTPEHNSFVNVIDSAFAFKWKPLAGASMYRFQIADNLAFNEPRNYDTSVVSFTDYNLQNIVMGHGKIYYWQVSALTASGTPYGTSERRQFTVDNLAPQSGKITEVIDYQNLNPQHVNVYPLTNTTYVKTRNIRIKVFLYEGAPSTVGYSISAGYVKNIDGQTITYTELGKTSDVHGNDTNEVDITLPNDDGEYRLVAYVMDRANNRSTRSEEARVYLNRKVPKINSIVLTDPSPNMNAYITSGKIKFEVIFNTPIDMLPLTDYVVKPSIKFDPRSAEGTAAIEITDLAISGKIASGFGYIPYGKGDEFNGMADVIVTGFLDAAWNTMEGGSVTMYKYFEIDTAPGFGVRTFLNPVDEKNVLINIQASETLLIPPSCYMVISNGTVNQLPVNIMAKNLYATSTTGTVGENNVRVSGIDTRNNVGYWPPPDVLKESKFLMASYDSAKPLRMASESMGVSVDLPANAAKSGSMYVFPYKLDYIGNNILSSKAVAAKNLAPKSAAPARMAALAQASAKAPAVIKTNDNKLMMVSRSSASSDNVDVKLVSEGSAEAKAVEGAPELVQRSQLYDVAPSRNLRAEGRIAIACPFEKPSKNAGVYYSTDGILWDYVGGKFEEGKFVVPMKTTGVFGVFEDAKPPVLTKVWPDKKTKITSYRPELGAVISELGSGVDPSSAAVVVDGVRYPAEFDEKESKVVCVPTENIAPGAHSVVYEIADKAGNVTRQAGNIVVPVIDPKIVNAVAYPNPVRSGNSTVSFTLDGTLGNAVDAKVYIYDVNANPVTELMVVPDITGANKYKATWLGLTNDGGDRVANGVYFYKIKVNCVDKSAEKFGKIAVLR